MTTKNNLAIHLAWLEREKPYIPPPPKNPTRPVNALLPAIDIPRPQPPPLPTPSSGEPAAPTPRPRESAPAPRPCPPPPSFDEDEEALNELDAMGPSLPSSSWRMRPKLGSLAATASRALPTTSATPRTPAARSAASDGIYPSSFFFFIFWQTDTQQRPLRLRIP
jgi:hypothetical protein